MRTRLYLTVLLAFSSTALSQWRMAEKSIVTRWGRWVTPENAWQEYPRPQLVRSEWQNLNGLWDFALQPKTAPAPSAYRDKILVPFCVESALSGVGRDVAPEDRMWYRRQFTVPPAWAGQSVILHFEAVDWATAVWVNGAFVGAHQGAYDRFSFDITACLKASGPQTLEVCVDDPTSLGTQARGKQQMPQQGIWYTPVSGIWQTVWLEPVSRVAAIEEVKIVPDVDSKTVTVIPMLFAPTQIEYVVDVTVLAKGVKVAAARVRPDQAVRIPIDDPILWSPDNPFLYDLKLELRERGEAGQVLDEIESYFGMRKISL
ncbi:MAG: hypothetical protein JW741_07175, partial [Sedimentisphaerales bacterium]|nr:hypothetical protein [Sedimentisphaerales bacterium]